MLDIRGGVGGGVFEYRTGTMSLVEPPAQLFWPCNADRMLMRDTGSRLVFVIVYCYCAVLQVTVRKWVDVGVDVDGVH